jgi:hypothetical protein
VFSSPFFSVKCNRAGVNRGEEVLFTLWVISDSGQCTGKQRSFLQPNSGSTQKTIEERGRIGEKHNQTNVKNHPKTAITPPNKTHHNLFIPRKNTLSHTVKKRKKGESATCQKTTPSSSETNQS